MRTSPEPIVPEDIHALAESRRRAREQGDWAEADRLRGMIEAAGWKVVDHGASYRLSPAHPPTVVEGGRVRYGSSLEVASRLDDVPVGFASIVMVATDWPEDLARAVGGLAEHGPDGTQVIVVAEAPSAEQEARLAELDAVDPGAPGIETEVVRMSARVGYASALNAGLRRVAAPVAIVLDTSIEPIGDLVTPLVRALNDMTIGVAGAFGMRSGDLRHFTDAPLGEVDAIEGCLQAFRRGDYVARGPLDERFRLDRNLDIWWSLVLRDEGEGAAPRRAVTIELPLERHERRAYGGVEPNERDRLEKRNFYRVLDRFGARRDLLLEPAGSPDRRVHDRTESGRS